VPEEIRGMGQNSDEEGGLFKDLLQEASSSIVIQRLGHYDRRRRPGPRPSNSRNRSLFPLLLAGLLLPALTTLTTRRTLINKSMTPALVIEADRLESW
jgi:hypothetical protein